MRKVDYCTITNRNKKFKIIATQRIADGYREGGYKYAIFKGKHLIDTGHITCQRFSNGVIDMDVADTLSRYLERYED